MLTLDLHNILALAFLVFFFYLAYKVGAFILKICIGLFIFYLIAVILAEIQPELTGLLGFI